MTRVSWATTSADDVEAVVGVLLCLQNPEASRIKASRGDGGIDVLVPEMGSPRRIEVYQVKSFTGRMTASRRGQVERSLQRLVSYCAQHDLEITAWYLTVPITWTNEAREWFLEIAAAQPFPCHWRGEDFLDGLAGQYPEVVDYYLGDGRERLAEAVGELSATLRLAQRAARRPTSTVEPDVEPGPLQPAEALEGLTAYHAVLNRDPHFRYDFSLDARRPALDQSEHLLLAAVQRGTDEQGWITVKIFARFREAVVERPVPGVVTFDSSGDDRLAEDLRLFHDFGRPFNAPQGTVTTELDLPGGLGGRLDGAALEITPAAAARPNRASPSDQLRLAVLDPADEVLAEVLLDMQPPTRGARGLQRGGAEANGVFAFSMRTDLTTGLTDIELQSRSVTGLRPALAIDGLRFHQAFRHPHRLLIRPAYGPDVGDPVPIPDQPRPREGLDPFLELTEALFVLQGVTLDQILLPESVSGEQWSSALEAAKLVGGEVVHGTWDALTMHLHPGVQFNVEDRFAVRLFFPLIVELSNQNIELGYRQVDLPIARVEAGSEDAHDDHIDVRLVPAGSEVLTQRFHPGPLPGADDPEVKQH